MSLVQLTVEDLRCLQRAELTLDRQSLSPAWPVHGMLFAIDGKATADGDKLKVALQRLEAAA